MSRYFCCKRSTYERAINSGVAALCQFAQRLKRNLAGILAHTPGPLGTGLVEGGKEKGPAVQGLQELGAGANQIEQSDCRFFSGRAPPRRWAK